MSWVRMDDRRALNGKLRDAGLAARGLDEACIEWASANETDGYIAARDVDLIAAAHGEPDGRALAGRLEAVGRWEPAEGGWLIHDYLEFNPSRQELEERREGDRQRKRRQRERAERDETTGRFTRPVEHPETEMSRRDSARNPQGVRRIPSRPVPSLNSSSLVSNDTDRKRREDDETNEEQRKRAELVELALLEAAERRLQRRQTELGPVRNPEQWLAATVAALRADHAATLTDHATSDTTPETLADLVDTPPKTVHPADRTAAAADELRRRADQPPCPTCGTRGGNGWLPQPDNTATRCPDCTPQTPQTTPTGPHSRRNPKTGVTPHPPQHNPQKGADRMTPAATTH